MKVPLLSQTLLASMALASCPQGYSKSQPGPDSTSLEQTVLVGGYLSSIYPLKISKPGKGYSISLTLNRPLGSSAPSWISEGPGPNMVLATFENANVARMYHYQAMTGDLEPLGDKVPTVKGPAYSGMYDSQYALVLGYTLGGYNVMPFRHGKLEAGDVDYAADDPLRPVAESEVEKSAKPHMFVKHPKLPVVYIPAAGADAVYTYQFHDGKLRYQSKYDVAGAPRHMRINNAGTKAWVITEESTEIVPLSINPDDGTISNNGDPVEVTECDKIVGAGGEILLSPDEKHLVASNRQVKSSQHDFLTTFPLEKDGTLGEPLYTDTGGQVVRGMAFNKDGSLLMVGNQVNGTVVLFRRDSTSGNLEDLSAQLNITAAVNEPNNFQPSTFLWMEK